MGSGTITLRVLKPDPMPVADRDGQPYRETDTRTSRDAGPYLRAVCARGVSGWRLAVGGSRVDPLISWPEGRWRDAIPFLTLPLSLTLIVSLFPPLAHVPTCPRAS